MRRPGAGSYARPERERRFLVRADPPGRTGERRIEDRYVTGTTLRLRHVRVGQESVYKLTQKVRVDRADPAREAARAAIALADGCRPRLPVLARTRPTNAPAQRVAQASGLQRRPDLDSDGFQVFASWW